MDAQEEITLWLQRIEEQPDEAMQKIWHGYYDKLVHYAKKKLGGLPRRAVDEEDVALAALNSFFLAAKKQRFPDLKDRDDLWKILLTLTARKAGHEIRSHLSQKRGGGAVRGESVFVNANGEQAGGIQFAVEPSEAFGDIFADELLERLSHLDDPRLREIAIRKLEGYTNAEIAKEFDCAERTVERKLGRIRSLWDDAQN